MSQHTLSRGTVVLVDTYWPSRLAAPEFHRAGYRCVRVQSTTETPISYREGTYVAGDFVEDIIHDGDLDRTLDRLRAHDPVVVYSPGEGGVEFADTLSEALGTPTNGTALSYARRDKYTMIETLRRAGLRATRQLLVENEQQLRAWHERIGGRVVVKPSRNGGGIGVTFCDTPESSVRAYRELLGTENIYAPVTNDRIIAQEYLQGTEYVVNTVSRDGQHHVTDIWRTTRISLNGVTDLMDGMYLMTSRGEIQDRLTQYSTEVLDALGILHGPAHLEIKLTPQGPCLVEMGARMCGGDIPQHAGAVIGESQLEWTARAYVEPAEFAARRQRPYELKKFFAIVPLASPYEGRLLKNYRHLDAIRRLESYAGEELSVLPGQPLRRTVDDFTYPLGVHLMHDIEEIVHRDSRTIRYLDGYDFYEV